MKNTLLLLCMLFSMLLQAQENQHPLITQMPAGNKVHRCAFAEYEQYLQSENPDHQSINQFEEWMEEQVKDYVPPQAGARAEIITIPIIFHIVHRGEAVGEGTNVSAAHVYSQIEQLNDDFRRKAGSLGDNSHADGADTEVEFCAALRDENENPLAEPGINRINALTSGLGAGVYTIAEFDMVVKEPTQWDPDLYCNFWSADLGGGVILGYAQFPDSNQEGLSGGGEPLHDGVVCLYSTIGGEDVPAPNDPYHLGRTGTHEIGHWLGLRHIWGDGDCAVDDFVYDTPNAADSNGGCPDPKPNSCDDSANPHFFPLDPPDQMENYMDYSADVCFNMFTNGQKDRIRITMGDTGEQVPRRWGLRTSPKCTPLAPLIAFDKPDSNVEELTNCAAVTSHTVELRIDDGPSADAIVTVSATGGTATPGQDFNLSSNVVIFEAGATANQSIMIDIIQDAATEGDETIELTFTISTGGDATASTINTTHTITINDDDPGPLESVMVTQNLIIENWNSGSLGLPWVTSYPISSSNVWTVASNADIGNYTAYITNDLLPADPFIYNNLEDTKAILSQNVDAAGLEDLNITFDYICGGEAAAGDIYDFGTIVSNFVVGGAFTKVTNAPLLHTTLTSTNISFDLPDTYDGQTFDIGFQWFNDANTGTTPLSVDNIYLTGKMKDAAAIQTSMETSNRSVYAGQTVHFYGVDGNIIATIENASADLGCVQVQVLSNGNAANLDMSMHTAGAQAASKTYKVVPAINPDASYTFKMYYTDSELSDWSTGSGSPISDFSVFRTDADPVTDATVSDTEVFMAPPTSYMDHNNNTGKIFSADYIGFGIYGGGDLVETPLPIELLSFTGKMQKQSVLLEWETAVELNASHFEIERSTDGRNFVQLGKQNTTASEGQGDRYTMEDQNPQTGTNYYRLKIIDLDGTYEYSRSIAFNFDEAKLISSLYPNPAQDLVYVNLKEVDTDAQITVYNTLGQRMEVLVTPQGNTLQVATNRLSKGTYFFEVQSSLGRELKRVVIHR